MEKFHPEESKKEIPTNNTEGARKDIEGELSESQELSELVKHESESLRTFFGKEIEVPPLPVEITAERYRELRESGFELHYFPAEELSQDRELPGWKMKPNNWFFGEIKNGHLANDSDKLPGAWIAIDERNKPQYKAGRQVYENDALAPALERLRKNGVIKDYEIRGSRFNISYDELQKSEVKEAFAQALGVVPKHLRLPRAIEWNYLGNLFYSTWDDVPRRGDASTWECLQDIYRNGQGHLSGGESGVSSMHWDGFNERGDDLGFRLIAVFPSRAESTKQ